MFDPSYFSLYFSFFGFSPILINLVSHYTYSSGWCRSRQPYRWGRADSRTQRLIPTQVTDPLNRTLKTCFIDDCSPYNNLTPITTLKCRLPTLKWRLPTLLNSNSRSIVHKIDEMTNIIDDNEVDIACITETWLSDEVPHCVTDIDGYTFERRDRVDRRGGGEYLLTFVIAFHTTVYLFLNATWWNHYGYW